MSQNFSNNVDTTLAAELSNVATSASLTSGAGLSTPTGGAYELLTLWDIAGNIEIVRMTARSGNTVTITRAQEGTAARTWPNGSRVFTGVTASTLAAFLANVGTGTGAMQVGSITKTGARATFFGNGTYGGSEFADTTGIGYDAWCGGQRGVAIGALASCFEADSIAIGYGSYVMGPGCIVIGSGADVASSGSHCIAIGTDAFNGDGDLALGADSFVGYGKLGAIALGNTRVDTERTAQIGALPAVTKNNRSYTQANAAWMMSAPASVIMSEPLDLKTLQTHTIPMPLGVTFFPEEVGVIITAADGVTGQPTLRFGITGTEAKFLAATATTGMDAVHQRERFATLLSDDGAKTLRAEVTVVATGTTLTGRVYWRGYAVVDS